MFQRRIIPTVLAAGLVAALAIGTVPAASAAVNAAASPAAAGPAAAGPAATDGPGTTSYHGQSRKDCVGTARNTGSKIWFTVANGVLSDVYAPTVDATNVQSMQYLVTDGATFTDLQQRDTSYTVSADTTGMVCTVTATAKSGAYRLVNTYFTDPTRSSVVTQTKYVPLTSAARNYRLYLRLDATPGGSGGGGGENAGANSAVIDTTTASGRIPVSFNTNTVSQANRTAYAVPSYLALAANKPFSAASSGFVGTASDGLTQLDATHALGPVTDEARAGNVVQTVAMERDGGGNATVALGFGTSEAAAVATATSTAQSSVAAMTARYKAGWVKYDSGLRAPLITAAGLTAKQRLTAAVSYYHSVNVVKASEDKTYPGAIVAGLDAPWGQSIVANSASNLFHGGYREVFARDLYEAWTALYTAGDLATARATVRYLFLTSQQADGSQPRNSLLDGTKAADAFNNQLDESAYPLLMALQSGLASDATLWPHVREAANFLVSRGPSYGVERWEEQEGYSPSTIAAEIAGLVAAAEIAKVQNSPADARVWLATADQYQRSIKNWGVTTTGSLSADPYFIRLSKTGDPNAPISYNLGNGGPTLDQRDVVDFGFLEYVRLGILPATDPVLANSLAVADAKLKKETASGPGWLRYNGDGYGDCIAGTTRCTITGAPWTLGNVGTGHPWPVLAAERAQQYLAEGQVAQATALLATINRQNSGPGLVPEQIWDGPNLPAAPYGSDPASASIGFVNGQADGSASPLSWGSAAQVRLTANLVAGRSLEQPIQLTNRYVTRTQTSTLLTVSSPEQSSAAGASVTVAGTAAAGARIDVARIAVDAQAASTTNATAVATTDGTFSIEVPTAPGTNVLAVTSTASDGGTAQLVRTVVSDVVEGTLIYSQDDAVGDDNGPGNYALPTAGDFKPGAFDLTKFQIYDTGTSVTFRVQTRDLSSTFGATNGAQLVDVYVHNPAATATSTAASYPGMSYTIAPGGAWSRLIEVQGFGNQKFLAADGSTAGTVAVSANSISRYITFSVDKAALGGTPASGWGFTVALTGQDGTHGVDQTRAFTATPSDYTFGVCAPTDGSARCATDPNTVPKVLDLLTPAGISQATELDYLAQRPVQLRAVTLP
ncbi:MAG: glucan 1,4-alpha-glucosidase [Microbacteriaceae bacterium]|nr:glucan 1,4-alpha-glucosidase [Microbacteriaceae bacterium]